MIQENEMVMLLLGIGCTAFVVINRQKARGIPEAGTLIAAFFVLIAGYGLTVLEGFFWGRFLNTLEHICYAGSAVLLSVWCWRTFSDKRGKP